MAKGGGVLAAVALFVGNKQALELREREAKRLVVSAGCGVERKWELHGGSSGGSREQGQGSFGKARASGEGGTGGVGLPFYRARAKRRMRRGRGSGERDRRGVGALPRPLMAGTPLADRGERVVRQMRRAGMGETSRRVQ